MFMSKTIITFERQYFPHTILKNVLTGHCFLELDCDKYHEKL